MSELIQQQDNLPAVEPAHQVTSMFQVLERAATNPDVDVEKMERIYQMVERAEDRQAAQAYSAAMNAAQTDMPKVIADSKNDQTHSKYVKLDKIIAEAGPVWLTNGFSLSFSEGIADKEDDVRIVCECMHKQGHSKLHHLDLALDDKGIKGNANKTPVHGKSSTMSYGQRILTTKIFNIPTGDDNDGNSPVTEALFISEVQAQQVHDIIDAHKDEQFGGRLLGWLSENGVESVEQIPKSQWDSYLENIKKAAA